MTESEPIGCQACTAGLVDSPRRHIMKAAAVAGLTAPLGLLAAESRVKPAVGDRLVIDDPDAPLVPLRVADIPLGKPVLAFPFDTTNQMVLNGSRLNKVVLMRFAESDLDASTRAQSAAGVLAYSALCTHQGCELKTWSAKEKLLVCFCHSSKFRLQEGGVVAGGPAPRPLPSMPLKLVGDQIAVAGNFSAIPGGQSN